MNKQFRGYMIFGVAMVMTLTVARVVMAGEEVQGDKAATIEIPNDINELNVLESKLMSESKTVSAELFKVLTSMRMEKSKIVKNDPEIKALNEEISKLRAKVEKLTIEKSKDMGGWVKRREELADKYDALRKELFAIKEKRISLGKKATAK